MRSRIPIVPTLLVLAAVGVMMGLGDWQLKRAKWKEGLLAQYANAETRAPIVFPTMPVPGDQLPLFRHATGVCLRVAGHRAIAGENQSGEPGYVHILDCTTGAEGPGMAVEVGWSKDPNAKVNWAGGPVSGIIVPDRVARIRMVAATAPPGLQPSKTPSVTSASAITPAGHRGYAATWFGLAAAALLIYALAVRKRLRDKAR
jgi:cytochrome oxidase assembly protein ShyY1